MTGPPVVKTSFSNLVLGVLLIVTIGWVLYVGRGIIVPFVIALLLVYVVIGLAQALDHLPFVGRNIPEWARNLVALLAILSVLVVTGALVITNADGVTEVLPLYESRLLSLISSLAEMLGVQTEPTWTTLRDEVLDRIDLGTVIGAAVASVSQIVAVAAVVLIYAGFLLAERARFGAKIAKLSDNPETVAGIEAVIREINERIGQYLALKTLVNVVLGLVSWLLMRWVGVEFAGFWAVLIGLLNYIPYLGSFLGVLFPVALSVVQFADLGVAILLLVVLSATQMVVGSLVEPYVMGNSLNLSPTVILLSLAVWSALWGVAGAILSVPITASIAIVLGSFEGTRPIAILLSNSGEVADPVRSRAEVARK